MTPEVTPLRAVADDKSARRKASTRELARQIAAQEPGRVNVSAVALHQLEENPFATADL